jgi:hypothetical protein
MIRVFLFLAMVLLAIASAVELRQRQLADHLLITSDPVVEASREFEAGNRDEARLLAAFARDSATSGAEYRRATGLLADIEETGGVRQHATSFVQGALTGEPRDLTGFLGSLSLDLFVVGDIRDIAVQGYRELHAGDGDMLILALSGIGLVTTLSPHLDFAPALLKQFRRLGAFSERFVKSLNKASSDAVRRTDFRQLLGITTDFGVATKALGPAPMARIMKHVDDPVELAHVARLANKEAASVFSLSHLTHGKAIKSLQHATSASTLAKAARRGSRLGKVFAKAVQTVPDSVLKWTLVLTALAAAGILSGWLPRRARPPASPQSTATIPVLVDRVSRMRPPMPARPGSDATSPLQPDR